MPITDLLTTKSTALHQEVSAGYAIHEAPSGSQGWTSFMDYDKRSIEIGFSLDDYKEECLVHELLHMRLESHGFQRPNCLYQHNDVAGHLFNVISHAIIFPEYTAMGFHADLFLGTHADDDVNRVIADVTKLEKSRKVGNPKFVLMNILSMALSPGPSASAPVFSGIVARCSRIDRGYVAHYRSVLAEIAAHGPSKSPEYYINRLSAPTEAGKICRETP